MGTWCARVGVVMLGASLLSAGSAHAACTPPAAAGLNPPPGTVVTCTGTTSNANPPSGYGTGTQDGLTVNVVSGATVTGPAFGFSLNNGNTVSNLGSVSAVNAAGDATGIAGNVGLTLTNSGSVSGTATGFAIGVSGGTNLSVANAWTISASSSADLAIGVFAPANNTVLSNSGTISAAAATTGAFAVFVLGNAVITNSGTITATGFGFGVLGGATAIEALNHVSVTNSGTLSAVAPVSDAFTVDLGQFSTVTNSGTISATGQGVALGINIGANGTVVNSGTVSASSATGGAFAIFGQASFAVTNSGTVSATSTGNQAAGVVGGDNSILTNSGTITATGATVANGVFLNSGRVVNSGSITANGGRIAFGINSQGALALINTGNITAGGPGSFGVVAGFGSPVLANTGSLVINTGTISGGTGLFMGGTVVNAGRIIGTNGIAIDFATGGPSANDVLMLLPSSRIQGRILLGINDTVNVIGGNGISSLLTFGDANGNHGLAGAHVNVFGSFPFAVVGNQIATVDPTLFGLTDRTLVDVTGAVSSLISRRLGGGTSSTATAPGGSSAMASFVAEPEVATSSAAPTLSVAYASTSATMFTKAPPVGFDDATVVWSGAFAGARNQPGDGTSLGARTIAFGSVVGMDRLVRPDSAAWRLHRRRHQPQRHRPRLRERAHRLRLRRRLRPLRLGVPVLRFEVWGGNARDHFSRTVADNLAPGGLTYAQGTRNGWFVAPEGAWGTRIWLTPTDVLTPVARLRYVAGLLDGYTETGSAQNLAVGSRVIQNLEERLGLSFTHYQTVGTRDLLKVSLDTGVLGLERFGDTSVSTVLLGQNLAFVAPGRSAVAGVYAGLGFDFRHHDAVSFFGQVEGTALTDRSITGAAKGGMRVAF